jgi:hypothetical protein
MASSTLESLKNKLGMGARANRYMVMISAPVGPSDDITIDTLCKGGSIPGKTIGQIEVFNQGRKLIIAGDAQYENTWTLTFWNTEDMALRDSFDKWMLYIDDMEAHTRKASDHSSYMADAANISQLSSVDNSVQAVYQFRNLWPTSISSVDLADDSADTITEFSVDFAFSHFVRLDTY